MFSQQRILTIDDSYTVRQLLRYTLESAGAEVEEAELGLAGVALVQTRPTYHLILLDLLLPDIDGLAVLQQLRPLAEETTIVMLTGAGGIKSAMAAAQLGADGYVEKHTLQHNGDFSEFFYELAQANRRRQGVQAQRQLQKTRADFYSMIAHDLRSPITSVLLANRMLLDEVQTGTTTHELLELSISAASKALDLVNDYLDFAKIDAGYLQLNCTPTDLRLLINYSAQLAQLQAQAHHQTLTLHLPPDPLVLNLDAERTKQVLDNLLNNAVKYTPEDGQITVTVTPTATEAVVLVSDTGCGIPLEMQPTLFTKYYRAPNHPTRTIGGTGLGLLISREIVHAHGGTLSVTSDGVPGRGSTFTMRLPRSSS